MRLFSQHPDVKETDYLFMSAFKYGPESFRVRPKGVCEENERIMTARFKDATYGRSIEKLFQFCAETEKEVSVSV